MMIDSANCDPRLLDHVDVVVELLIERVGLNPDSVLLVGADCREILHSALGHAFVIRSTDDTDIGIALSEWTVYERIATEFARTGSNGIRYLVDDNRVDIMPFGGVESPDGIVTGQNKDGKDIAAAMYWYQESDEVKSRLYDCDAGLQLLESVDWDADLAAARILGADARAELSPRNAEDIARRWKAMDHIDLARELEMPAGVTWTRDLTRRLELVSELSTGLSTPVSS